ncbi:MAG: ZIP family metal transporter [Bacteriovoracia bacterium]
MNTLGWICTAIFLNGIAGFAGGFIPAKLMHRHHVGFLAFAAGTLLGVAFLDLLPEALHSGVPHSTVLFCTLLGFVIFHLLTSFVGSHAVGTEGHHHHSPSFLILLGDGLHNITDGVAIAAAFMNGVEVGIATTITVIIHEVPHEISDYTLLVRNGYSKMKAVISLFFVQLSAVFGALGTFYLGTRFSEFTDYAVSFSAGGFLYIAAADLIPELARHKEEYGKLEKILAFWCGILLVALLSLFHAH